MIFSASCETSFDNVSNSVSDHHNSLLFSAFALFVFLSFIMSTIGAETSIKVQILRQPLPNHLEVKVY